MAVHGIYLLEGAHDPTFHIPIVDVGVYHDSAVRFAQGRGLSGDAFWQPPLFPLALGCAYRIAGPKIWVAKAILAIVATGSCLLVWWLGRRLFSPKVGLLSGVMLALYGPFVFYGTQLLALGLGIFLDLLALLLWIRCLERPRWQRWWVFGLVSGLATITIPNAIVLLLLACGGLCFTAAHRLPRRQRVLWIGAAVLGFVLPVGLVALRNHRVSGDWVLISANGGLNFYIGNHLDSDDLVAIRPGEHWKRLARESIANGARSRAQQDSYFYRKTIEFVRSNPIEFCRGLSRKCFQFINAREIPRNEDPYVFRGFSSLLSVLMWRAGHFAFPFGLVAPLAALGVLLTWKPVRQKNGLPVGRRVILAFAAAYSASVVLFFVSSRYRLPVVPVIVLFAAAGALGIGERLRGVAARSESLGSVARPMVLLAIVAIIANLPLAHPTDRTNFAAELAMCVGDGHAIRGNGSEAERFLRRAMELDPGYVEAAAKLAAVLADRGQVADAEARLRDVLSEKTDLIEPRVLLGTILRRQDRTGEAARVLEDALSIDSTSPEAHAAYADVLFVQGEIAGACAHYATAIDFGEDSGEVHLRLGDALLRQGAFAKAIEHYRQAVRSLAPDAETLSRIAWLLATCPQIELRDCRAAMDLAWSACELTQFRHPGPLEALAAACAECGDFEQAVQWERRAIELASGANDVAAVQGFQSRLTQYEDRLLAIHRSMPKRGASEKPDR
jgi:tetratricopeptide (TPR) repeat protein